MDTLEKIRGTGIGDLLAALIADRSFVRFEIPKSTVDGLTVIREIRTFWTKPYFLIDVPDGFWPLGTPPKTMRILFEFIGRDKLKHRFRSNGGKQANGNIWLRFPDVIHRIQQRESFRVELCGTAKMIFRLENENREMGMINFSEGGALAEFRPSPEEIRSQSIPRAGSCLNDITLVVPCGGRERMIKMQRLLINRATADPDAHRYIYGLQFTDIEPEENIRLVRLIFDLQREYLKER